MRLGQRRGPGRGQGGGHGGCRRGRLRRALAGRHLAGVGIGFTVNAAGVTAMDLAWNLSSCNWASSVVFEEAATIDHGELVTEISVGPGQVSTNVSITFSSAASAAGTLKFAATAVPDASACMGVGTASFAVLKT